ncbi:unnamed protein product (macronuclear) [Paramecium tetraurelia]|uniref:Transmembrane protein n=1 Tax=Paramecium tetraurelia TaxID=5888 RepID=A0BK01_PARTE|nr:uncharacterized protein GSPATT00029498001 [Paramecium tetraurelia]CAK58868.1 unnamed protein product [Paramecium tetraurelia]|eukprot:XP_001426266.1 hypothetical protein (macronuclear) [Paramecium tetraurelia strain d4-2]
MYMDQKIKNISDKQLIKSVFILLDCDMRFLPLIFLILILTYVSCQTLFYEAFSSIALGQMEGWITTNAYGSFSDCGGTQLFGGFDTFGKQTKVMKFLQLPPHYEVQIKMRFWKIDTWDNEYFYIFIDGIQAFSQQYTSILSTSLCGNIWGEEILSITMSIPHVYQSILILMTSSLDEPTSNESWGFRDFQLFLSLCPSNCVTCTYDDIKKDCISWSLLDSAFLEINSSQTGFKVLAIVAVYHQLVVIKNAVLIVQQQSNQIYRLIKNLSLDFVLLLWTLGIMNTFIFIQMEIQFSLINIFFTKRI